MYWYRHIRKPILAICCFAVIACAVSCSSNDTATGEKRDYYPIHDFFRKEVDSLQRANPTVSKSVGKGNEQETKEVHIKNWENEMGAFLSVDLSKPAYEGMYSVDSSDNSIIYTALSPDVDISLLHIGFNAQGQIDSIEIVKSTSNILYQNKEKLTYKRGVSYTLTKNQDILLLGANVYHIIGELQ